MYNRYIPQPDGSYRRRQMSEPQSNQSRPTRPEPQPQLEPEPEFCPPPEPTPPCAQCPSRPSGHRPTNRPQQKYTSCNPTTSVGGFLKNLLPGNFDTEDLLIVLLLLLMSGECRDDRNIPLLTLALYLFL